MPATRRPRRRQRNGLDPQVTGQAPALKVMAPARRGPAKHAGHVDFKVDNRGSVEAEGGESAFTAGGVSATAKVRARRVRRGEVVFEKGVFNSRKDDRNERRTAASSRGIRFGRRLRSRSQSDRNEEALSRRPTHKPIPRFGRLDLIGRTRRAPAGFAAPGFLGLAEGNLTLAIGSHGPTGTRTGGWARSRGESGARLGASYVKQVEARSTSASAGADDAQRPPRGTVAQWRSTLVPC